MNYLDGADSSKNTLLSDISSLSFDEYTSISIAAGSELKEASSADYSFMTAAGIPLSVKCNGESSPGSVVSRSVCLPQGVDLIFVDTAGHNPFSTVQFHELLGRYFFEKSH